MTNSIPANQIVSVTPGVIAAGGSALALNGLMITNSARPPIGQVLSFPTQLAVADYFGPASYEAYMAQVYFAGFDNSNVKPGAFLVTQYPQVAVAAFMRGGTVGGLTLAQLQALTGTLTIVIDGYTWASGTINLSSASSFSSAASIIETGLTGTDPVESTFTGSIGASFTGNGSGTNLTASSVTGIISIGDAVAGSGVPSNTKIVSQTSGPAGGAGVYVTNNATTSSTAALTSFGVVVDVTAIASGTIAVGQTLSGTSVTGAPLIASQVSGTAGGIGIYTISAAQTAYIASETMNGSATLPAVSFDSVSESFVVTSGITGVPSTMAFATGSLAIPLNLTQATGAVLSQGAAAATPSVFMDGIVAGNQNWASFFTTFDPDGGSGNTIKLEFANWNGGQDNRWDYLAWDTDITPTESTDASASLGQLLKASNTSGTECIYAPINLAAMAAFRAGAIASLDFTETNGRATSAFRSQSGLVPDVTDATSSENLIANGYNFYGTYATANDQFTFFYPGSISGEFLWSDSYVDQIQLTNALQLALMVFLTAVKSVPYTSVGYALISAACTDPITSALNFGTIRAGVTLSAAQIAEVNNAAGQKIDDVISAVGWYLQVLNATPQVRQARGSPPITLWYADGQSVQKINVASLEVQ